MRQPSADARLERIDESVQALVKLRAFYYPNKNDYRVFALLSQIRLSSVTFVRPTQGVETFDNISSPFVP